MRNPIAVFLVAALVTAGACATTSTSTTTVVAVQPPRFGRVEAIRLVIEQTRGDPVGGAVVGAVIGGLLFGGRHPVLGAIGGAGVGAAASQGAAETRRYVVTVRFDDGGRAVFVFADRCPFVPGELVSLTARGLEAP